MPFQLPTQPWVPSFGAPLANSVAPSIPPPPKPPSVPAVAAPSVPAIQAPSVGANAQPSAPPPNQPYKDPAVEWLKQAVVVLKQTIEAISSVFQSAASPNNPVRSWDSTPAGPSVGAWRTAWQTLFQSKPPNWMGK